jgi:hypothetical protein
VLLTGLMVAISRQQSMEDTLLEKHSRTGLRIWRALAVHGCMQGNILSVMTMFGIKSVGECLYKMAANGYVTTQVRSQMSRHVQIALSSKRHLQPTDVAAVLKRMLAEA